MVLIIFTGCWVEPKIQKKGRKIIGITYIVIGAKGFIKNQKVANKRNAERDKKALQNQLSFF